MATLDLIAKASDPAFYQKVMFIALKVAQNVASEAASTPNHANRIGYVARVLRGDESAILLASHVISANGQVQATIESGAEPPDGDLEFVLASIWDARANAFAS